MAAPWRRPNPPSSAANPVELGAVEARDLSLWIYLDINDIYVAWEAYRGNLLSSGAGPIPAGWSPISLVLAGAIRRNEFARLQHELWMEAIRSVEFRGAVSRLRSMYYFPDRNTAERAIGAWSFTPAHFRAEFLAEVAFETAPVSSRHDSHWIDEHMFGPEMFTHEDDAWIRQYWAGDACPGGEPLGEILVEGSGWILGTDVRERAYDSIAREQPGSLAMLELARVAAALGSTLGHCAPLVHVVERRRASLQYVMDYRDATDEAFLARFARYEGPKNLADLNPDVLRQDGLRTPDFMDRSFDFAVPPELGSWFQSD